METLIRFSNVWGEELQLIMTLKAVSLNKFSFNCS